MKKGPLLAALESCLRGVDSMLAVSPGIQYFASQKFLLEFSAPIPVVNALRGAQPRPDSSFVFGFRYLF